MCGRDDDPTMYDRPVMKGAMFVCEKGCCTGCSSCYGEGLGCHDQPKCRCKEIAALEDALKDALRENADLKRMMAETA